MVTPIRAPRGTTRPPTPAPPEKDVDPVCHMNVQTAQAKSAVYDGHAYYFCSQDCRAKFEADPHTYVKAASDTAAAKEHHHAC